MPILSYFKYIPDIHHSCFVATNSTIIGQASLGAKSNVWFGSVIRADVNEITIGENTNIQDLCILHVTDENSLTVGSNVTVGHNVTLHACSVGDGSLIGMGSVVLDGAVIGKNSVVAAGSVVPPGKEFPEGVLILGNPAKVKRELTPEEVKQYSNHYKSYVEYSKNYKDPECVKEVLI